jgi:hypothetical protein
MLWQFCNSEKNSTLFDLWSLSSRASLQIIVSVNYATQTCHTLRNTL